MSRKMETRHSKLVALHVKSVVVLAVPSVALSSVLCLLSRANFSLNETQTITSPSSSSSPSSSACAQNLDYPLGPLEEKNLIYFKDVEISRSTRPANWRLHDDGDDDHHHHHQRMSCLPVGGGRQSSSLRGSCYLRPLDTQQWNWPPATRWLASRGCYVTTGDERPTLTATTGEQIQPELKVEGAHQAALNVAT